MSPPPPAVGVDRAWPQDPPYRHDARGPGDAFPVPFSVLESFGAVFWTLVAAVVVSQLALVVGIDLGVNTASVLVVLAGQLLTIAGVVTYLRWRGRLTWRLLGPVRPRPRHVAVGIGIGIAGFLLVQLGVTVGAALFGPVDAPRQSLLEVARFGGLGTALAVVAAVVLAPVVEEVVFRGLLFQALRRRAGVVVAAVVSAVVFAVVHLELRQALFAAVLMVLGGWLAAAFHRTGTLIVAIVGHATFNAINLGLALGFAATGGGS